MALQRPKPHAPLLAPHLGRLVLIASLALLSATGCQKAGGSVSGPKFSELRESLDDLHQKITAAAAAPEFDRVSSLGRSLSEVLDAIESRSSSLDLLSRETLALHVASARKCLTDVDRYATSGDQDLVQAQVKQLDGIIGDIGTVLERGIRIETAK